MNINVFENYEIEYQNKYCYINEYGDHADGIVQDTKTMNGGELAELIAKEMMEPNFLDIIIEKDKINIALFDPNDGTDENITITIKEVQRKEL